MAGCFEILGFIEPYGLMRRGIGDVDMQVLASAAMLPGLIWTRDRTLNEVADSLALSC